MYGNKTTPLQSLMIPARSLEEAKRKLTAEVQRRMGECEVIINATNLYTPQGSRYSITMS